MASKSVPKSLYKYLAPERACGVLRTLLIRFSQASVMNDKSEFKPPIKGLALRKKLETVMRARFEVKFPGRIAEVQSLLPDREAEQLIRSCISNGADEAEQNFSASIDNIYKIADRNFGILSLSENPASIRMWKRYADLGTGLLIEFDPNHPWFWNKKDAADDFRHLRPVRYVSNRRGAYLLDLSGQDYLYTKKRAWECEKEWRVIRNFNDRADIAGKDPTGTDIVLFAIPPDCILSVVAGYKATQGFVERIQQTLTSMPSLSHVHFKVATLTKDGFIDIAS